MHSITIETEGQEWFEVYNQGVGGDTTSDLRQRIVSEIGARDGEHDVTAVIRKRKVTREHIIP